jgi:hypothetical protein
MKTVSNNELGLDLSSQFDMPDLPNEVVDSHRLPIDLSGDVWRFNDPVTNSSFDFAKAALSNKWLLYSMKRHLIFCIQRVSPRECWNTIRLNHRYLSLCPTWDRLRTARSLEAHSDALSRVMSEVVELLRSNGTLYHFSRIRAWYRWCVDYLPDLGFDADEAYRWELIRVPGNEKGVAVRTEDPEGGPLNDAELILLRNALQSDQSMALVHVQQRAAIWISLIYGRNPANIAQLRVGDLVSLIDDSSESLFELKIPRIKKRRLPRTDFKSEFAGTSLVEILKQLIEYGNPHETMCGPQRPLFVRQNPREHLLGGAMNEWAWHLTTADFTKLIQDAVSRYSLISPRTGKVLQISTRRLRYTFATNRVKEGISAIDLADSLDHTDLQNVRVYFDAKSSVVERLDRAAAVEIAPKLQLFKGQVLQANMQVAIGIYPTKRIRIAAEIHRTDQQLSDLGVCGQNEFCKLHPPYSCYPCDRFQPFADSVDVHEQVLTFLIDRRERLRNDPLESTRIAVQLDEVIYACAEVIQILKSQRKLNAAS